MSTILDQIIEQKKEEIATLKPLSSIERFEAEGFFWQIANRSLKDRLQIPGSNGIIAEFKRKSPSKGWFKPKELEVETVVKSYNLKAAGISVLTDTPFFGGDLDDLIQAKVITDIPVLRKDFIIDKWQIAESKAFGADVILLIAACLTVDQVAALSAYAHEIGLEVLLELHDEEELGHICNDIDMVGINNRDLKTFTVDLQKSIELVKKIPSHIPVVAESGISNVETIVSLRDAGFSGFLIGETFMKQDDPGQAFTDFVVQLNSLNGS